MNTGTGWIIHICSKIIWWMVMSSSIEWMVRFPLYEILTGRFDKRTIHLTVKSLWPRWGRTHMWTQPRLFALCALPAEPWGHVGWYSDISLVTCLNYVWYPGPTFMSVFNVYIHIHFGANFLHRLIISVTFTICYQKCWFWVPFRFRRQNNKGNAWSNRSHSSILFC